MLVAQLGPGGDGDTEEQFPFSLHLQDRLLVGDQHLRDLVGDDTVGTDGGLDPCEVEDILVLDHRVSRDDLGGTELHPHQTCEEIGLIHAGDGDEDIRPSHVL